MTFAEAIDRARNRSCAVLRDSIEKQKSNGSRVHIEPAPRSSSGDIVFATDGLKLPLRFDFVYQDTAGIFQKRDADAVTIKFSEPLFVTWEQKLKIEIHQLCWNQMAFDISPLEIRSEREGLRRWFIRWFDAEDNRSIGTDGLYGVVHFISDPEIQDTTGRIVVDLGSASSEALGELFDEFIQLGAQRCVIGKPATLT